MKKGLNTPLPEGIREVANTLNNATGARIKELPLTPKKVLNAIQNQKTKETQEKAEPVSG